MLVKSILICFLVPLLILSIECQTSSQYRLPKTTAPLSYTVNIDAFIENAVYNGVVTINVKVLETTNELVLHSQNLKIKKILAYDQCLRESFQIIQNSTIEESDLYIITFKDDMNVECVYEVMFEYEASFRFNNTGFFLTYYEDGDNSGLQALTDFDHARSIFPCYDEPEYKAIFTISIETSLNYNTISNMPITITQIDNRKTTQFDDTVLLSPSSLAFVISDFEEITHNDHCQIFYVRESQLDFVNMSLEIASAVYDELQKYLGDSLLSEIRHVAVPSADLEAKSFYGLINYRETSINFNPQSSPDLKKIQIAKLFASGIAKQYFGIIVTDSGFSDMWLTKSLVKFLEYYGIMELDISFELEKLFVIEKLQKTLNYNSIETLEGVFDDQMLDKVCCIFRMINFAIGEENFKNALQTLFEVNKFSSISPIDFYTHLKDAFGSEKPNIVDVMESWINVNKVTPVILIARNYNNDNGAMRISRQNEEDNPVQSWIPYNYLTENGEISNIQWLEDTFRWNNLIVGSLKPEEWILFNVNQFGFYRVNYDANNWKLLINALKTDHTIINEVNRAQMLDDSFYLVKRNLLSISTYLDLIEYLEKEENYLPWATAVKGLQELKNKLLGSEVEQLFKLFNQKLIKQLYMKEYNGIDFMDLNTQSLATNWACDVELSECLQATENSFNSIISSGFVITANFQQIIWCNGLKSANDSNFELLWRQLQSSKNLEERLKLIDAVACYPKAYALKDYLESTISTSVEVQYSRTERLEVIKSVISRNEVGFEVSMDFLIDFKEFGISKNYGDEINNIFVEISKRITTQAGFVKFDVLLELYADELHPTTSQKCVDTIQSNLKWLEGDDYKTIELFLMSRIDLESTTLEPTEPTEPDDTTSSDISGSTIEQETTTVFSATSEVIFSTFLLLVSVLINTL